jgi:branched-chain amino acid transport system ATP-binding protein
MLEVCDLRVTYRGVVAVDGVHFDVEPGEVVGIVGPNGAGKTSTLRAICGLVKPASGRVRFDGEVISGKPPESIVRRGIALVPEGGRIFRTLTVAENLSMAGALRGDLDVESVLSRFPVLRERYRKPADGLSGGEAQQLAIARALLLRPRLLILDEPSFGLAPKLVDSVYQLLEELRKEGLTMLLVEQLAQRSISFADRCVMIASGRQRGSGTRAELEANPALREAYFGLKPPAKPSANQA